MISKIISPHSQQSKQGGFLFLGACNYIIKIRHRGTLWLNDLFGRHLKEKVWLVPIISTNHHDMLSSVTLFTINHGMSVPRGSANTCYSDCSEYHLRSPPHDGFEVGLQNLKSYFTNWLGFGIGQKIHVCLNIEICLRDFGLTLHCCCKQGKGIGFIPFECLIRRSVKEPIISEKVRFFVDLKNLDHTRQTFHERKENNGRDF